MKRTLDVTVKPFFHRLNFRAMAFAVVVILAGCHSVHLDLDDAEESLTDRKSQTLGGVNLAEAIKSGSVRADTKLNSEIREQLLLPLLVNCGNSIMVNELLKASEAHGWRIVRSTYLESLSWAVYWNKTEIVESLIGYGRRTRIRITKSEIAQISKDARSAIGFTEDSTSLVLLKAFGKEAE